MGGLGSIFLLDAAERGEVDGLIVVDEAFVVIVRPTRSSTVDIDFIVKPKKSSKKLHNPTTFTIFAPMKRKIRTYGGNIYRVFFIFDEGEIVVLFNGFQKKTQKTPQNEIEKAIKIKEAYYADKQSQNR